MGLRGTVAKRIIQAVITVWIALSIDFVFFHLLPGNPASLLATNPNIGELVQERIIREFGLDQPMHIQYGLFVIQFLSGNLGVSFHFMGPVQDVIFPRLMNTILLVLPATIVSIITGIWIGKKSAWRRGEREDVIGLLISLVTYSIPSFWLSMFFIMIFSVNFHIFPLTPWNAALGPQDPLGFTINMIRHVMLPWTVLWIALIGFFALIMRSSLLDVLSEDYMITAKAKGRTEDEQLNKEAVPNAMIPVATVVALNIGATVSGALQVEVVFTYPGIGRLLWDGILYRDYPLLQATFFIISVVIIGANLIADFLYYVLDPRIRIGAEIVISEGKDDSYLRSFLRPLRMLLFFLILLNLGTMLAYPSYLGLTLGISVLIFALLKWKSIGQFILVRLRSYSLSNLAFLWKYHRFRLIRHLTQLVLTISLTVLVPVVLLNLFGTEWTLSWGRAFIGIDEFPPSIALDGISSTIMVILSVIAHPYLIQASVVLILLSWVLGRRTKTEGMLRQYISTPLGQAGTVLVAFFVCLAIYGDIIAPYDPEQHLTGLPYRRPSPLPFDQFLLLALSVGVLIIGIATYTLVHIKKKTKTPSVFNRTLLGIVIVSIGIILGYHSIVENHIPGMITSSFVALVGSYILGRVLQPLRTHLGDLRTSYLSSLSACLIAVGLVFFVASAMLVVTGNPTTYPGFHILGTDQLGRDTFSQLVIGVRITLVIGLVATIITMSIGSLTGLIAGYYGGLADSLLMRLTDVFFVIPALVIMIILAAILPPSVYTLIFVIGIFSWPSTARIVRGQVLTIKERTYIERVRSVGGSDAYIMGKHILPAVAPLIVANTVLVTAYAILSEVVLDFFGLGDPSMISWGTMLYQAFGAGAMSSNLWWLVFPPGIAVVVLLMGVSMVGYAMDEIANPRLRRR
ncbi:MAG: ABC transporter permease subunit [Candidatus Thorarchaeota archaeon]|nr:MAG: ABC transporter permease subunit [Candidatus Thorarchaeota archaeon]